MAITLTWLKVYLVVPALFIFEKLLGRFVNFVCPPVIKFQQY